MLARNVPHDGHMKAPWVFLPAILFCSIIHAQIVSVGALGGVPLIDQTNTYNDSFVHDESRPYIVGASIEFKLPAGFAIEADALYQRVGNTFQYPINGVSIISSGTSVTELFPNITRNRANAWEFPLLGKHYFRRNSAWQPFLGVGPAFRTASFHQTGNETFINEGTGMVSVGQTISFNDNFHSDLEVGATVAAGLRYRKGHLAFLPQFRYTRWAGSNSTLRKDEANFMLGVSF